MVRIILFFIVLATGASVTEAGHKPKKPKNVILMIGDGMGLSQISAGLVYRGGDLNLGRFKYVGFIKTQSADNFITDSAAGATAFSIGVKTRNGAVGVDTTGAPRKTLLELSESKGLSSGLVVTCALTHATPAAFVAHRVSRRMEFDIASDFLKSGVDVAIGGGMHYFSNRPDRMNLPDTLRKMGYTVADSSVSLESVAGQQYYYFSNKYHVPSMADGRGDFERRATLKALGSLSGNRKGFFMMVEGSQIDWGGHDNNADYIASEMADFDKTIGAVLDWAEKDGNTLVIVTADHETGGFALNGGSMSGKTVTGAFTTKEHTAVMVPVFAFGPGAEDFSGIYENTGIFFRIANLLKLL